MICENCKCVVPDASDHCMYCGHKFARKVEKTSPVTPSTTRNVTFYEPFPETQRTEPATRRVRSDFYENNSYGSCGGYDDYRYKRNNQEYTSNDYYCNQNSRSCVDNYNKYRNREHMSADTYYDNEQRYCRYEQPRDRFYVSEYERVENRIKYGFSKALIALVAIDVIFLLLVLMILLLVTL